MKKLIPLVLLTLAALTACAPSAQAPLAASFQASAGQILEAMSKAAPSISQGNGYEAWFVATVGVGIVKFQSNPGLGQSLLFAGPDYIQCIWQSSSETQTAVTCSGNLDRAQDVLNYIGRVYKRL